MKIKILSYNFAMLPGFVGKEKKERVGLLAAQIIHQNPPYDVICLLEIFDEEIRRYLVDHFGKEYPYILAKCDRDILNQDSGMFLASRHRIIDHSYEEFDAKEYFSTDGLADKGILNACIELNADNQQRQILHVYLTHLQATGIFPPSHYGPIREKQLTQIRTFMEKRLQKGCQTHDPANLSAILLGDFNIEDNSDEYHHMMGILGSPIDLFPSLNPGKDGNTWNTKTNRFVTVRAGSDPDIQRLDYIFTFDTIPGVSGKVSGAKMACPVYQSCDLFTPLASAAVGDLSQGCDLSDHYGVEAVFELL
ncbi:MAG: sphingomyelin phosphodiesterase [Candidatus Omnitrophota bacterium]